MCALWAAEVPVDEHRAVARVRRRARAALPDRRRPARRRRLRARVGEDGARRLADEAAERARARLAEIDADTDVLAEIVDGLAVRGRRMRLVQRCRALASARSPSATSASSSPRRRSRRSATASRTIALVFAVLHISHNSPTAVGIVLACRQARPRRSDARGRRDRRPAAAALVLVAVACVQAAVQAVVGALLVGGHATVALLAVLAAVYGLADGFVIPAQNGLIPAVVSAVRLQQANALLGLSAARSSASAAPALGGILVVAREPGLGDPRRRCELRGRRRAALARVHVEPREDVVEPEPFLRELREGWSEFRRQRWIFNTIVFFGIGNFAGQAWGVLAPLVVKDALRRRGDLRRSSARLRGRARRRRRHRVALASAPAAARRRASARRRSALGTGCSRSSCRCRCCSRRKSSPGSGSRSIWRSGSPSSSSRFRRRRARASARTTRSARSS